MNSELKKIKTFLLEHGHSIDGYNVNINQYKIMLSLKTVFIDNTKTNETTSIKRYDKFVEYYNLVTKEDKSNNKEHSQ